LVIPTCFFTFYATHFLLPFQWYPFTISSPLMIPVHSDDTHWIVRFEP
jgi:hypothetical protein